jgi:hypothetical protein
MPAQGIGMIHRSTRCPKTVLWHATSLIRENACVSLVLPVVLANFLFDLIFYARILHSCISRDIVRRHVGNFSFFFSKLAACENE